MTSDQSTTVSGAQEAYVWMWLPSETQPVVIGRLYDAGESPQRYFFTYGRSYLERPNAIPLSPYELPLERGPQEPQGLNRFPCCIRDGGPDAWGRRVLENTFGETSLTELDYFLLSRSDRIGALDFQASSSNYHPRTTAPATMENLLQAAELVEQRQPLPPELEQAALHGSSVGGARPKALIENGQKRFIAKFSTSTDTYDVVRAEFVAMRLAKMCGLDVAEVLLERCMDTVVLLVERFDRVNKTGRLSRKHMLSALSLMLLNEMEARYASYIELADLVRQRFVAPEASLRELFTRISFNILVGNTDDHARNHAAFWDGDSLALTPAYDICPQGRAGGETTQAMDIGGKRGKMSTLDNVRSVCGHFLLSHEDATSLINQQHHIIQESWKSTCDEAELAAGERARLWERAILNPFCFEGWQ